MTEQQIKARLENIAASLNALIQELSGASTGAPMPGAPAPPAAPQNIVMQVPPFASVNRPTTIYLSPRGNVTGVPFMIRSNLPEDALFPDSGQVSSGATVAIQFIPASVGKRLIQLFDGRGSYVMGATCEAV